MTEDEAALAKLRSDFPAWEIWLVPSAVRRGGTWCANPWAKENDRRNVLHADSAAELTEEILEYQDTHPAEFIERGDPLDPRD